MNDEAMRGPRYQRQVPSPNSLAMSGTTAASPSAWYAVRQSGLRAFSMAIASFDLCSGFGGTGMAKIARCPAPSLAICPALLRAASRSMRGAVGS